MTAIEKLFEAVGALHRRWSDKIDFDEDHPLFERMGEVESLLPAARGELARLIRDAELLQALENHGVDNWEGYYDAKAALRGEEERT